MSEPQNPPEPRILSEPSLLFVDDDPDTLDSYRFLLRRDPIRILTAPSGLHALEVLRREHERVIVVVSDYWMMGMTGVALLDEIARIYPAMGRVLLTGSPDSEIVLEAARHKVLMKSLDRALIRQVILREVRSHAG